MLLQWLQKQRKKQKANRLLKLRNNHHSWLIYSPDLCSRLSTKLHSLQLDNNLDCDLFLLPPTTTSLGFLICCSFSVTLWGLLLPNKKQFVKHQMNYVYQETCETQIALMIPWNLRMEELSLCKIVSLIYKSKDFNYI